MSVDLELDRDGVSPPPPPPPQNSRQKWLILAAVVLAIAGGAFARWWTLQRGEEPPAAETVAGPTAPAAAGTPPPPLPPLDQMDPYLRGVIGALSSRPELARWLATEGLLQQMAVGIDRLSRGASPAADLRVLAPTSDFTVEGRGFTRTIDPASYARYDALAETIASIDPAAAAKVYQTVKPRLGEAYTALGRTETDVDVAVQQALEVLIETPIPQSPVQLVEGRGATWAFADPALEGLDPAQKQLLRMGPENASRIIEMLKQFQQHLRQ
jgi:hypothetical protein